MRRCFLVLFVAAAVPALLAGPTNSILFVTQVPVPADFGTIASTFGNQQGNPNSCGRGGDLYIRYPDGTLKNLTRAAGYGQWGVQAPNGIAVRQPCVHWSGQKAVFSMVVGSPSNINASTTYYWQLYEITNFTAPGAVPIITKVPNQPTNFNNISPIYGSDDRIIFTSDRPRNGERQLYPQLDEYEELATVTGLWSLQPTNGDLYQFAIITGINSWSRAWRWCILGHGKKTNQTGDECDGGGATQRTNPRRHRSPRQRTDAGGAVGHQWPAYLGGTGRVGRSRPLHHPSMAG